MKNRLVSIFAAAAVTMSVLPQLTLSAAAADDIRISSQEELASLAQAVTHGNEYHGQTIKLTSDIALEGAWSPIGNFDNKFRGTFDGCGYTISGLYIDSSSSFQGLFGAIGSDGVVKNLTVSGSVTGNENVGGVTGLVAAGGLIESCTNKASVTGGNIVGGVAGQVVGEMSCCVNSGSVKATGKPCRVGGLTGDISGVVSDCYNTGNVVSQDYRSGTVAGGICGWLSGTVSNCYNTGTVSGANYNGAIAGEANSEGITVSGCVFTKGSAVGNPSRDGFSSARKLANDDFDDMSNFSNWDNDIWCVAEFTSPDFARPVLLSNVEDGARFADVTVDCQGSFTSVNGADNEREASLWVMTVDNSLYAIEKLNAKVNGIAAPEEDAITTTITSGAVAIGIVVNALPEAVESVTAVINDKINVKEAVTGDYE